MDIDSATPPLRRTLRRIEQPGHARFLTFSCFQRFPLLDHDGIRSLFVARLRKVCAAQRVLLLGWVLMPEHVHLVVFPDTSPGSPPPDLGAFSHAMKRPFAEAVIRRWKALIAPILQSISHGHGHRY